MVKQPVLEAAYSPVMRMVRPFRENKSFGVWDWMPVADSLLLATVSSKPISGELVVVVVAFQTLKFGSRR